MFGDLLRALDELRHGAFWAIAAASVALTLAVLVLLFFGLAWLIGLGGDFSVTLPWLGEAQAPGIIGTLIYVAAALVLSLFLTGPIVAVFVGLFLEKIVASVERRAYPDAGKGTPAPPLDQLRSGLRLLVSIGAATAAVLLISAILPPALPVLLVVVNGWLLGREYVDAVALRRMPEKQARAFRKAHRLRVFGVGLATAVLMAVPVMNLLAPLIGAAAATHLFHRARSGH